MTVSSITPVNNYQGDSFNKKFDFDFLIESEEELVVNYIDGNNIITTLKHGIDYSITGIGNENGGYITFPLENSVYGVLKENERISLALDLKIKQESEFRNSLYFNFDILEWTFDYIVRVLQILNRKVDLCVKVPECSSSTPDELLNNINQAEKNTMNYKDEAEKSAGNAYSSADSAQTTLLDINSLYNQTISMYNEILSLKDDSLTSIITTKQEALNELNNTALVGKACINLSNLTSEGEAHFANPSLTNINDTAKGLFIPSRNFPNALYTQTDIAVAVTNNNTNRKFIKLFEGFAIAGWAYLTEGSGFIQPILVGNTSSSAIIRTLDNEVYVNDSSGVSLGNYYGQDWYVSSTSAGIPLSLEPQMNSNNLPVVSGSDYLQCGLALLNLYYQSTNKTTPVESFISGTSGYNVYADGKKEQWGIADCGSLQYYGSATVTFLKPYLSLNYNVSAVPVVTTIGESSLQIASVASLSRTSMVLQHKACYSGQNNCRYIMWYAVGY